MGKVFIFYLLIINIITFLVYGIDKWKAQNEKWRISENTLLIFAAIGGSVGALAAMHFFRHKTQKNKFKIGVPVILIIQLFLLIMVLNGE